MSAGPRLVVVRPQPGADRTAAAAAAAGWAIDVLPLFATHPVAWPVPDPAGYDALLLTSAAAVRHGGTGLAALATLPVFAVGAATAAAARGAGMRVAHQGAGDGRAAAAAARASGHRKLLHLAGHDRVDQDGVAAITVYASDALPPPADVARRLRGVVLLHSPRSAARVAALATRGDTALAAISAATLAAAGPGWRAGIAADRPTDAALLAAADRLRD